MAADVIQLQAAKFTPFRPGVKGGVKQGNRHS
jgi:hypothetical protein